MEPRGIRIVHGDHTLRFEVDDISHAVPSPAATGSRLGGFGLLIVGQLAESWGWDQTATGKRVWCNLSCCSGSR